MMMSSHSVRLCVSTDCTALSSVAAAQGTFMTQTVVGSPKTCSAQIEEFLRYCELDGLMMIFPDYVEGLTMFGAEILPGLRAVFS